MNPETDFYTPEAAEPIFGRSREAEPNGSEQPSRTTESGEPGRVPLSSTSVVSP